MDKSIKWLVGLLTVQLVFALLVSSDGTELSAQRPDEPLIAFDPATVTGVEIAGPNGESVSLAKSDAGWIIPNAWNSPAKQNRVDQLLKQLHDLKKGLAVATTAGAQTRFEVAQEKFQRRVTLLGDGGPLGTLYLGTSPGLRKIHARADGSDPVYAVSFAAYEAPAKPDGWLDTELLQIGEPELEAIELDGLTLTRRKPGKEGDGAPGPAWSAGGLAQGEQLHPEKARELADKIARLTVHKVLGTEVKPEYRQDRPERVFTLRWSAGEPVTWTLSKPEKGEDFVLKTSDHPWYFEVVSWAGKPLLDASERGELVAATEPPADTAEAKGDADQQDKPVTDSVAEGSPTSQ